MFILNLAFTCEGTKDCDSQAYEDCAFPLETCYKTVKLSEGVTTQDAAVLIGVYAVLKTSNKEREMSASL